MTETWSGRTLARLHWLVSRLSYGFASYRHPLQKRALDDAKKAYRQTFLATTPLECAQLHQIVAAAKKIPGDLAEVGVYLGGTAHIMLSASTKRLHLFDTFEGLPHSENQFAAGEWKGTLPEVKRNLSHYMDRIEFHPGLFPASAADLEHLRFSVVHLDLDLHDGTLASLEWFWPRLSPGGIIVSHDYPRSEGVVRAFQEFFEKQPETFIPLSGHQCLAIKGLG